MNKEGITVCSECGGPMHMERLAYGRTWECDRGRDLRTRSAGPMRMEDREPLTKVQIATAMARRSLGDSKERAKDQANYRRQHATDTKGNFVFDRTVTLAHSQCMLDGRRKR